MTREEAIDVLTLRKDMHEETAKALDMAIEALSDDAVHIETYRDLYEKYVDLKHASAEVNYDGCDGCRYEQNTEYEYPCNECKQRYKDRWKQKPNDFIEVVRCKNCKHYSVKGDITLFGWCGYWNRPADEMVYCSFAERREESEVEE